MDTKPLFSILIANYNNGKYLKEAIDSVYAQTYTNWEIILVDNASNDESKDIYRELGQDVRIRIFYNEQNKGVGYTKRKCAELANGELCGFLDPDDILLPKALEIMVNAHLENNEASVVCSRHYRCDENLNVIRESLLLKIPEGMDYFTMNQYRPLVFASYKKCLYDKTVGLSAHYLAGDDQQLYFLLEEEGPICAVDEFTYKYRIHNSSLAHSKKSGRVTAYWNMIAIYEECVRRGLDPMSFSFPLYDKSVRLYSESTSYKVGHFLLLPMIKLKLWLNSKRNSK